MVIDRGEPGILRGEMSELLERFRRGYPPVGYVGEQPFERGAVHAAVDTGVRYCRKISSASAIRSTWKRR